jgi:hypothetical protein
MFAHVLKHRWRPTDAHQECWEGPTMISGTMAQAAATALPRRAAKGWSQASLKRPPIAGGRACLERVGALLSCISRNNSYEGRDPCLISDSLTSGFVAELLGVTVTEVAESLVELGHLGLVAPAQGGALQLADRTALEAFVGAH